MCILRRKGVLINVYFEEKKYEKRVLCILRGKKRSWSRGREKGREAEKRVQWRSRKESVVEKRVIYFTKSGMLTNRKEHIKCLVSVQVDLRDIF